MNTTHDWQYDTKTDTKKCRGCGLVSTGVSIGLDLCLDPTSMLVSQWRAARAARLLKDKEAAALKEEESFLKAKLIAIFQSGSTGDGIVVEGRVTGLSTKEQPIVGDRDLVVNYILENKDLSILQFRLATTAIAELKEGGVDVPGISYIDSYDLYDRKV